jgi:hypothetical protein
MLGIRTETHHKSIKKYIKIHPKINEKLCKTHARKSDAKNVPNASTRIPKGSQKPSNESQKNEPYLSTSLFT